MKLKIYPALFVLVLVSSFQCAFAQNAKVVGKWTPDMEVMKPILKEMIEKEMGNIQDEAQKEMAKGMIDMMLNSFAEMTMEFKADGTYASSTTNPMTQEKENDTGTWRFEDGHIFTKKDGKEEEEKVKVKEVTGSKMIIVPEEDPKSPFKEFVMKRAN